MHSKSRALMGKLLCGAWRRPPMGLKLFHMVSELSLQCSQLSFKLKSVGCIETGCRSAWSSMRLSAQSHAWGEIACLASNVCIRLACCTRRCLQLHHTICDQQANRLNNTIRDPSRLSSCPWIPSINDIYRHNPAPVAEKPCRWDA